METLNGVTVLVVGASGFLGRHLLAQLGRENANLHAVSRIPCPQQNSVRWWQGNAAEARWVRNLVADVKPEIIYQLASASMGGQNRGLVLPTFENDLQTTVNILVAALECGCGRVIISGSLEEPLPSCKPKAPSSPYAAAKAAAGLYGRMFHELYSLPVVILRPFMTYGPGQKDHKIIPYTIQSMLKGLSPLLTSGTRLVDWVYVDDVIKAFVTAATASGAVGMEIDVGSGTLTAIRDVVEHIRRFIQHAPEASFGSLQDRANEQVRVADVKAAKSILGWAPSTSLSRGLSQTVEWYRRILAESKSADTVLLGIET